MFIYVHNLYILVNMDYTVGLQEKIKSEDTFDGIIGRSKLMKELKSKIELAAENDLTVLISGESGTGKELVARSIHKRSNRASGPFVTLNSGAMAKDLVPSELFGHERGAFTGATELKNGVFESANNGTLFLDELSSMDYKTQTSLLRVLENKEFRRVGGKKTFVTTARILTATNRNLQDLIKEGKFRKDLYYRFEVFIISVPPLRKHWEDIADMVRVFINDFNRELGKNIKKVPKETMDYLIKYDWPGNVRELRNNIQRAMMFAKGTRLLPEHLPKRLLDHNPQKKHLDIEIGLPLHDVEKRYIERTLWWLGGNKLKTAKALGISRRALYNKIEEYNI